MDVYERSRLSIIFGVRLDSCKRLDVITMSCWVGCANIYVSNPSAVHVDLIEAKLGFRQYMCGSFINLLSIGRAITGGD